MLDGSIGPGIDHFGLSEQIILDKERKALYSSYLLPPRSDGPPFQRNIQKIRFIENSKPMPEALLFV